MLSRRIYIFADGPRGLPIRCTREKETGLPCYAHAAGNFLPTEKVRAIGSAVGGAQRCLFARDYRFGVGKRSGMCFVGLGRRGFWCREAGRNFLVILG